jgi:hypothetical protein
VPSFSPEGICERTRKAFVNQLVSELADAHRCVEVDGRHSAEEVLSTVAVMLGMYHVCPDGPRSAKPDRYAAAVGDHVTFRALFSGGRCAALHNRSPDVDDTQRRRYYQQ